MVGSISIQALHKKISSVQASSDLETGYFIRHKFTAKSQNQP